MTDTDASTAPDTITINTSDNLGNSAAQQSVAVTVATTVITAPNSVTVGVDQAGAISGISISESSTTSSQSFTVVLADTNGVLAANTAAPGGGGMII